jgi:hypothetical protein
MGGGGKGGGRKGGKGAPRSEATLSDTSSFVGSTSYAGENSGYAAGTSVGGGSSGWGGNSWKSSEWKTGGDWGKEDWSAGGDWGGGGAGGNTGGNDGGRKKNNKKKTAESPKEADNSNTPYNSTTPSGSGEEKEKKGGRKGGRKGRDDKAEKSEKGFDKKEKKKDKGKGNDGKGKKKDNGKDNERGTDSKTSGNNRGSGGGNQINLNEIEFEWMDEGASNDEDSDVNSRLLDQSGPEDSDRDKFGDGSTTADGSYASGGKGSGQGSRSGGKGGKGGGKNGKGNGKSSKNDRDNQRESKYDKKISKAFLRREDERLQAEQEEQYWFDQYAMKKKRETPLLENATTWVETDAGEKVEIPDLDAYWIIEEVGEHWGSGEGGGDGGENTAKDAKPKKPAYHIFCAGDFESPLEMLLANRKVPEHYMNFSYPVDNKAGVEKDGDANEDGDDENNDTNLIPDNEDDVVIPPDYFDPQKCPDPLELIESFEGKIKFFAHQGQVFEGLRRAKHNVFWSNIIFRPGLRACIDSFLRFCKRPHDFAEQGFWAEVDEKKENGGSSTAGSPGSAAGSPGLGRTTSSSIILRKSTSIRPPTEIELKMEEILEKVRDKCVEHVFWVCDRMMRKSDDPNNRIGDLKFVQLMREYWSLPKLLDFASIYGDSNAQRVLPVVQSVVEAILFQGGQVEGETGKEQKSKTSGPMTPKEIMAQQMQELRTIMQDVLKRAETKLGIKTGGGGINDKMALATDYSAEIAEAAAAAKRKLEKEEKKRRKKEKKEKKKKRKELGSDQVSSDDEEEDEKNGEKDGKLLGEDKAQMDAGDCVDPMKLSQMQRDEFSFLNDCLAQIEVFYAFFPDTIPKPDCGNPDEDLDVYIALFRATKKIDFVRGE